MASWSEHVMWWHLYPLGFVGAPIRPGVTDDPTDGASSSDPSGHGIVHRLPRIEAWLDHVVELGLNGIALGPVFASTSHGYDTVDHFRIDPRLGDDADFDSLVRAAHERGLRVLLDGVFNHVGRAHPLFRQVEEQGPQAAAADLFRIDWDGWQPGQPVRADVFEGHDQLVALHHGASSVVELVTQVMVHWLDRGADGWRLDAAYAVPPEFWAKVLPEVRRRHPDSWFVGEVIHGAAADIVSASTLDSITQYELWQGIWHGIADRNFFELSAAIDRNNALLATFIPSTFVGNHDVTRIASAVGIDFVPHALAVLFTVAGIPSVYAGDEFGWAGVKEDRLGGDDAVRPEFPGQPPAASSPDSAPEEVLRIHRELIALRRRHPWLVRAHTDTVHLTNGQIVLRTATGDGGVLTALNLDDRLSSVPVADGAAVLAGEGTLDGSTLHLGARGWAILAI